MQPNADYRRVFRIGVVSGLAGFVCCSPVLVIEILKAFITGTYVPYLFVVVFVVTAVSFAVWQFRAWQNEIAD